MSDKTIDKMVAFGMSVKLGSDYSWHDYMRDLKRIATDEENDEIKALKAQVEELRFAFCTLGVEIKHSKLLQTQEATRIFKIIDEALKLTPEQCLERMKDD